MLQYLFTALLLLMQLAILVLPLAAGARPRPNIAPLLAIGLLWAQRLASGYASRATTLGVMLWLLFGIMVLIALSPTTLALFSFADKAKDENPLSFGPADAPKALALVYHPGASSFARTIDSKFAAALGRDGVRTTVYAAKPRLGLDPGKMTALGLSSPVYLGEIRPPLAAFIASTDLRGVRCFAILTGWIGSPEVERQDLAKIRKLIESKGGIYIGGKKYGTFSPPRDEGVAAFADGIDGLL
jgi:hypothetical protein